MGRILKDHIRPFYEQIIDHLRDGLLISRKRMGRKDHGVVRTDGYLFMVVAGHTT